jgi:hypothetical protein
MGIYVLLFVGTTPIGSYLCGQLAENVHGGGAAGVRATIIITAGLCALGVIPAMVYARRRAASPARVGGSDPEEAVETAQPSTVSVGVLDKDPSTA